MIAIKLHYVCMYESLCCLIPYSTLVPFQAQIYIKHYQKTIATIPIGTSALHYAVYMQDFEAFMIIVKYLQKNHLEKYYSMRDSNNLTAFELAIALQWNLVFPLMKYNCIFIFTQQEQSINNNPNPISVSIETGNLRMLNELLSIQNSSQYYLVQDYFQPYDQNEINDCTESIRQLRPVEQKYIKKCEEVYYNFCDGNYKDTCQWVEKLCNKQSIQFFSESQETERQQVWDNKEKHRENFIKNNLNKLIKLRKKFVQEQDIDEITQQNKQIIQQSINLEMLSKNNESNNIFTQSNVSKENLDDSNQFQQQITLGENSLTQLLLNDSQSSVVDENLFIGYDMVNQQYEQSQKDKYDYFE